MARKAHNQLEFQNQAEVMEYVHSIVELSLIHI